MSQKPVVSRGVVWVLAALGLILAGLTVFNSVRASEPDWFGFVMSGFFLLTAASAGLPPQKARLKMGLTVCAAALSVTALVIALT